MKKITLSLLTLAAITLALSPTAFAFEVEIDKSGTMNFYHGQILGKNSQAKNGAKTVKAQPTPFKTIPSYTQQDLKLKATDEAVEAEIQPKANAPISRGTGSMVESNKMTDQKMSVRMPTTQGQKTQDQKQTMIEIKSRQRNQKQALELKSKQVRAELKQGAEFKIDPETQLVTVITPSGNEHTLNHLPDQAVEKMSATGLFDATQLTDKTEADAEETEAPVKIETTDDGEVYYTTQATQHKRLFGLFPRQVETEVKLNDETGQVSTEELPAPTYFSQLLNDFSF